MSSATSQPSRTGIITSSRTTSGRSLRIRSSASSPLSASSHFQPLAARLIRQISRIETSSSTIKIRRPVCGCCADIGVPVAKLATDGRRQGAVSDYGPKG